MEQRVDTAMHEPAEPIVAEADDDGLRFDDPYWDDAFGSWCDPTLRTCCS